ENAASLDGEAAGVGTQHLRGRIPVVVALSTRHRDAQEIVRRQQKENGRLTPVGDREERDRVHARLAALRVAPGEAVGNHGERDVGVQREPVVDRAVGGARRLPRAYVFLVYADTWRANAQHAIDTV